MEGSQFDQLVRRLGTSRITRLRVLRGLVAGVVAGATGVGLARQEAGAKNNNNNNNDKEIRICVCSSADASTCRGQKKDKDKAKRTLRRNPCAYRGRCQAGVSGCATPRVGCQTNNDCTGGQVCVNTICVNCAADFQCTGNTICQNGRCQTPPPGFTPECQNNNDCSGGQVCVGGRCVACTGDIQCTGNTVCLNGTCQAPPRPTCQDNTQCTGGQVCVGGTCEPCTVFTQCGNRLCLNGRCLADVACDDENDCATVLGAGFEDMICNETPAFDEPPDDVCILNPDDYPGGDCNASNPCLVRTGLQGPVQTVCVNFACVVDCRQEDQEDCDEFYGPDVAVCVGGACILLP